MRYGTGCVSHTLEWNGDGLVPGKFLPDSADYPSGPSLFHGALPDWTNTRKQLRIGAGCEFSRCGLCTALDEIANLAARGASRRDSDERGCLDRPAFWHRCLLCLLARTRPRQSRSGGATLGLRRECIGTLRRASTRDLPAWSRSRCASGGGAGESSSSLQIFQGGRARKHISRSSVFRSSTGACLHGRSGGTNDRARAFPQTRSAC